MRSTVEPLEGNKVKVSVEVDETTFDRAVDQAFRKIAREVRLPGFRPGKAPRKLLETRLGSQVGREQALQDGLGDWYASALREHDVDVIAPPEIDITAGQEEGPVAFDAVVEVRPALELTGYAGLRVTIERPDVPEADVEVQIERMRDVEATYQSVERPAAEGDTVTIDIAGSLDDELQPGLTADDYDYRVGSGAISPEVDTQLVGASRGDVLEFDATHPDADEERELRFRIEVKEVRERVLPEATDEWAAEASDFETLAELRADLEQRMGSVRRAQALAALRERAGEALAELVADDAVPEPMVASEVNERLQNLAMRLGAQGIGLDQWLSVTGQDPQTLTEELRATALTAVKVDLALRAVADQEAISCDDSEPRRRVRGDGREVLGRPRRGPRPG